MKNKRSIGAAGEEYAARLLLGTGLGIVEKNYRCPKGEMDLIVRDGSQLVFVEVRSRSSGQFGFAEESITKTKQKRLLAVAAYYLTAKGYKEYPPLRFDVIALRWTAAGPEVKWLKGVF